MNSNSKILNRYIIAMMICTAMAVMMKTAAALGEIPRLNEIISGEMLERIANLLIVCTSVTMLTYPIGASKIAPQPSFDTPGTYVPSGLLGCSMIFLGIRALATAVNSGRYPLLSRQTIAEAPARIIAIPIFILSLGAAVHFFLNCYHTDGPSELRAGFSMGTSAFLALYAILTYLDSTVPIIDTGKIVNQMAFLLAAVFFLYESRISLGREMWRAYATFGLVAVPVTAYASITPMVIYYTDGVLLSSSDSASCFTSVEQYVMLFALFVYILSRLIVHSGSVEKRESTLVNVIAEYADMREARVNESYARYLEDFAARQLTFFELEEEVSEESTDTCEETAAAEEEEEEVIPTISDDAIYESIFGRMPEHRTEPEAPDEESPAAENEPEEAVDPEETADKLLNTPALFDTDDVSEDEEK